MKYNTQSVPIILKAYGRGIQQLVADALLTCDRGERQRKAQRIVEAMGVVSGLSRPTPEQSQKLWCHLAQMADYALDVDYPCAIERHDLHAHPQRIAYPTHRILLKHYGHHLSLLMEQLISATDVEQRATMIRWVAARMRRNLSEARGEQGSVGRIAHDIALYTNGKVTAKEVEAALQS